MEEVESGEYDTNKLALMMSQTGGGCRATNYIGFIRKALKDAGYPNIPVISFNFVGMEKNSGFKITLPLVKKLIKATIYGDLLQKLLHKNKAYEVNKGETEKLYYSWVGIVGEILIKYLTFGNNYCTDLLEKEGAEVVMPDLMGFVKYVIMNSIIKAKLLGSGRINARMYKVALKLVNSIEKDYKKALENSRKGYLPPCNIEKLAEKVEDILSTGNQTGEGWILTAEMLEFMEHGIQNIVCLQPFACLPNHVVGKGVIKTIRNKFPEANIAAIDYDPGASQSNQINRIKLLLTIAKDNIKLKEKRAQIEKDENIEEAKSTETV